MYDVGGSNKLPQLEKPRLADNPKRKRLIIVASRRSFRDNRYIELLLPVPAAQFRDADSQGPDDGLDTANAGRKIVGIDK